MNATMNAAKLSQAIRQHVIVRCEGLRVLCTVRDARKVWDRIDLLVVPCEGSGMQWVSLERCSPLQEIDR